MAQKRMFSLSVVDTDKFIEMPLTARLLYYELGMRADDDGFVANWRKIMIFAGLKDDDLKVLIAKGFVIPFESGVIVIRHWRLNNYLQNDRTKPTLYQDELRQLEVDENNVYNMYTKCIHSIDKNSIDKISIDTHINIQDKKDNKVNKYGEYKNVALTDAQLEKLKAEFTNWQEWIDRLDCYIQSSGKKYKDCLATIRNWARKEKQEVKGKKTKRITGTEHDWGNMNQYYDN